MTNYVLDTNLLSDLYGSKPNAVVAANLNARVQSGNIFLLCEAVDHEVQRGYLRVGATARLKTYIQTVRPRFKFVRVANADWMQAADFWVMARAANRPLSDIDLLVAAVTARYTAVLVSADDDFVALPVTRENWR